jgi:group I intron endonuclease
MSTDSENIIKFSGSTNITFSMILDTDEYDQVAGEIYRITNTTNNKSYIGQTRSHRLNHGKYRPFGYLCRFKSHISASKSSKIHCKYLNSAIRKYGEAAFKCELIHTCKIEELDELEIYYIKHFNSKYPNGYNLTNGGQGKGHMKGDKIVFHDPNPPPPNREKKSLKRSDETKQLISVRLKDALKDPILRHNMMKRVQNQHLQQKFDRFKNATIDETNIEQYIRYRTSHSIPFIKVKIGNVATSFVGKTESIEVMKERARTFIKELIEWQRDQTAGTPTNDVIPFTNGNVCEEHG